MQEKVRRRSRKTPNGDLSAKLVEVAIDLFWSKGFADANTRDIAIACGVSPGAMYFHYKSKAELLFRVLTEAHARMEKYYLDAIMSAGADPGDQFYSLVRCMAWFHAAHRKEAVVAHREFKFLEPPFFDQIRTARQHLERAVEGVIQRGLDSGSFTAPGPAPRPARQLTIAVGNMCNQIAEWYNPEKDMSPEDIGAFYAELGLLMVQGKRSRA